MKFTLPVILLTLFATQATFAADQPVAARSWFTQAAIDGSIQVTKPADALPEVPGTAGMGVQLTKPSPVENPIYDQNNGLISFWVKPNWNGNDGKRHTLLKIGDPQKNGLYVEKAASGMLRYVMVSPVKTAAARWDVSAWKAGEWHQVAISWTTANNIPVGMPLWIDKVCVDGPIFGGSKFPNPTDTRVWVGDSTSDAAMDELICRTRFDTETAWGQYSTVYRDYFRTAPYTKIAIDLHPFYGPMDTRVVKGCEKQFGLMADRQGKMEKVVDYLVRYGQWSDFDAKPFIKWSTSDEKIATVDKNGMVTGKQLGTCTVTADYRGMKASYKFEVIPIDQPDLDLIYVERLPKYDANADKNKPAPGDKVQSVAHIVNFGFKTAPAGAEVVFQLIPDTNRDFRLNANEKPISVQRKVIDKALKPREEMTMTFNWTWTDTPTWVRVVVKPNGKFSELCNANNERCELNTALALHMGLEIKQMEGFYNDRKINHIGSFSEYDWINGQLARFEALLRDTRYPNLCSDGVKESMRNDKTYVFNRAETKGEDEPWNKEANLYDGGFPVLESISVMAVDAAILHEFGHTCAALPDLYGYGVNGSNVFLKDEKGEYYANTDLLPSTAENASSMPSSSATNVPCGKGYPPLMDSCHMWLTPAEVGQIQWFAGYRGQRFWAVQDHFIPQFENYLKIYDLDDKPLKGAAIYVYPVINTSFGDSGSKYFADRPKFMGNTGEDGRFKFQNETDPNWDDPDTDTVEGAMYVENPFARVERNLNFTPNVFIVEGLLLVKIVSGDQTEFCWLPLTEFNRVFFEGNKAGGTIPIRTSLKPTSGDTPLVPPAIPDTISKTNLRPIAVLASTEITVKCGEDFTIDGSKSYDPEGQPLVYRWRCVGGWGNPGASTDAVLKSKAPGEPGKVDYQFYVNDGLRVSEQVIVHVTVVK